MIPPHPITNEAQLVAVQELIDFILDKRKITQNEKKYLKVLGTLVYNYEQQHEPMPILKGIEMIEALLEESNLQPKDLIPILGTDTNVEEILSSKRAPSQDEIEKLANFFNVSPRLIF
ncbi:putative transcription regulator with HTH domain protein [Calothrix sp. NIES-4071]|nr:putative transcription regulator with HTH domain protein [Calothrix sp. NIES-4071]BAZ59049.1 putative transcription regulator with HTH domain protein [Calothrix sp. NIES-4105]